MISQEQFDKLEMQYGCGYWNVCWEHACPCAITTENKGLREDIYNDLVKEAREQVEMMENEDDYYYPEEDDFSDTLPCGCCACCGCSCNKDDYDLYEDEEANNY